ncbi:sugar isomerase domain-containing protein [Caldivirga sp. UBA161]|uniref:sugar isomerase domain-containing protein n=1 Tax=Caldivirga sp. UBA161 TaxID=1915569 RepID=UPI0025C15210|nr:sugar isomerase domain-containing protein [Caldivirga sp. UBA161]
MSASSGYWRSWISNVQGIISYISSTQLQNIDNASGIIANTIDSGHACFLFGSGHAAIPVMEMFPRYGSTLGFIPIVDLPLVSFLRMVGDLGYPQFDFIENSPEYGRRIMENYSVHKEDCVIVFSHSGTTPISVEIAVQFKSKGAPVIGVTSLTHANSAKPRHPLNLKLHEVADVIIDTGVPAGDVSLTIDSEGKRLRIGPLSTIAFTIVANMLLLSTIEKLISRGREVPIFPVRGFDADADARMNLILRRHRELYIKHIAAGD